MCREGTAKTSLRSCAKFTSPRQAKCDSRLYSWCVVCKTHKETTDEKDRHCHRRASLAATARGEVSRGGAGRCHCQDEFEGGRRGAGFHFAGQRLEAGEAERFPRQEKRHPGVLRSRVHRWLNQEITGLSV